MEPVRLQKFLADAGICSRRAGEAMITAGEVLVNGQLAELGCKITPGVDRVTVHGRTIGSGLAQSNKVTLLVHKPSGVVCGAPDRRYRETIFDLVPRPHAKQRFLVFGRLDPEADGLVVLTADGALADRLARSGQVVRRFFVRLEAPFARSRIPLLLRGTRIEEELVKADKAFLLNESPDGDSRDLEVHVAHGRGRGLRELFAQMGCEVRRMQCIQIGGLKIRGMPLRAARPLGKDEIESLFAAD